MLIDLGGLSQGMGMIFLREFMETANHMSYDEVRRFFRNGNATHSFYTLIQGEISAMFSLTFEEVGINTAQQGR